MSKFVDDNKKELYKKVEFICFFVSLKVFGLSIQIETIILQAHAYVPNKL